MNLTRQSCIVIGCLIALMAMLGFERKVGAAESRVITSDRGDVPMWTPRAAFPDDVFTFVRIRYTTTFDHPRTRWTGDYPDADLNFSLRLHELTSIKVNPNGRVFDLTDEQLLKYPFAFMSSPGRMYLNEAEAMGLRRYLLNGGFLMVDDFWGRQHWENVREEFKKVFPNREPRDLPLTHPIFHIVYDFEEKPQVPSINAWSQGYKIEPWHGDMTDPAPHFRGYFDDKGRLMALLCHNNDLADGWEREEDNFEYFKLYSERCSYPMGINIVVYAMTH